MTCILRAFCNLIMGSCQSTEVKVQTTVSKQIDKQLYAQKARMIQKLLLLGPGESGKSTCLKQMQILHNNGFTQAEIEDRKCIVYSNTVQSMLAISSNMANLGIMLENQGLENGILAIQRHVDEGFETSAFSPEVKAALIGLWEDAGVRACYEKRSQYQLNDSAKYFFDNLERISKKDYMPTEQDILYTRVATAGVVQVTFTAKNIDFKVFDVGGQRSERRKWIHCFDDVNAIIYVAAISEYDQKLREDETTNRVMESLELFHNVVNTIFFEMTPMILFLNKKDLFAEKIRRVSLRVCFPSYEGGLDYNDGITFLKKQFTLIAKDSKKMYIHETCATDTNQVQNVINSVIDTIVQENLKDTGMI
ncbi:hypothetical protein L596_028721 [Steinernema carpocapsae]|uniref:Uncharacterized protein n=1 Tax=Steinernema carpocapsae TaxID=34508 RepID=A0A4U5LZB3_STECR|nr:hypothetical protein L596_028721 [Steinernema carpocapsae]